MKKLLSVVITLVLFLSSINLTACANNSKKYLGHRHIGLYRGDFCEECDAICWDSGEGYVMMELGIDSNQYFLIEVYNDNAFSLLKQNDVLFNGTGAYNYCRRIKHVYIASTVTTVHGFEYCSELENVVLCEGIEAIGYNAFNGCEKLENIELPKSITHIYGSAFSNVPIREIELNDNLIHIGNGAFYNTEISSIYIPDSVKYIDVAAFWYNENLKYVEIGKGVEYIGHSAFEYCNKNMKIKIKNTTGWCVSNEYHDNIKIDSENLNDKSETAKLFSRKYVNYDWKRDV